jgi:hypothetical protein
MQQFALASITPRGIAWLVRPNEWERLEQIVIYNSSTVGGFFNVLIPLTVEGGLTPEYERFLIYYDPDFIVLAPDMSPANFRSAPSLPHPFAVIPSEGVMQILNKRIDGSGFGDIPTMGPQQPLSLVTKDDLPWQQSVVAIADPAYPDPSRLALIACGEVDPHLGQYSPVDASDNPKHALVAPGYREHFLERLIQHGHNPKEVGVQELPIGNRAVQRIEAPDRFQLPRIINEKNTFPLHNPVERLRRCYASQQFPVKRPTFINLTAAYKRQENYARRVGLALTNLLPRMVLLVGNEFTVEEAALFWNLRACEVYVAWLSFPEVESCLEELATWMESDRGRSYAAWGPFNGVNFSSADGDFERLENIVERLSRIRGKEHPQLRTIRRNKLIFYDYERQPLHREHIVVAQSHTTCSFPVRMPVDPPYKGNYDLMLDWTDLRLPRHREVVDGLVSDEIIRGGYYQVPRPGQIADMRQERIPRFRVNREHQLIVQVKEDSFIQFNKPALPDIFNLLFTAAGYTRLQPSATARYHTNFIARAGDIQTAARFLAQEAYARLFTVLADNTDKSKPGWILQYPSKRRVLHHYHLREVLGSPTAQETKKYFDTDGDILPEAAVELLQKGLLERGFRLNCRSCSYSAWYPAEHIGQKFECARCFQSQVYTSNPLWLYKLPEVVFQGFEDNMQVPLLALEFLRQRSKHHFEYMADSDVYWTETSKERSCNIDLLCMVDGKLYIGEAKSNDAIEGAQFSLYQAFSERLAIDGLVFATQRSMWNQGTHDRISRLRAEFRGEILTLTVDDLYPK